MTTKLNEEYTKDEKARIAAALALVSKRAEKAMRYVAGGMVSSADVCLADIAELAQTWRTFQVAHAYIPAAVAPKARDNSRPLHVEAAEKDGDKFYVVIDAHGNFFAKTYSHRDAERIAEVC
jgi:hypothetical protein